MLYKVEGEIIQKRKKIYIKTQDNKMTALISEVKVNMIGTLQIPLSKKVLYED